MSTRRSILGAPRFWLSLLLITLTAGAIGLTIQASRLYQLGRDYGFQATQHEGWAEALRRYEPADPAKKEYVRQLSGYYLQRGRSYAAAQWRPWLEVGPFIEPPDRPVDLPGTLDPVTGTPPEVAEAIENLTGTEARARTSTLDR